MSKATQNAIQLPNGRKHDYQQFPNLEESVPLRTEKINYQEITNHTKVNEFILVGLSKHPTSQSVLFWALMFLYIVTLLHNLSLLDLLFSTSAVPLTMANSLQNFPTISSSSCLAQLTIQAFLALAECFLLAITAYDRFETISDPLRYNWVMPSKFKPSLNFPRGYDDGVRCHFNAGAFRFHPYLLPLYSQGCLKIPFPHDINVYLYETSDQIVSRWMQNCLYSLCSSDSMLIPLAYTMRNKDVKAAFRTGGGLDPSGSGSVGRELLGPMPPSAIEAPPRPRPLSDRRDPGTAAAAPTATFASPIGHPSPAACASCRPHRCPLGPIGPPSAAADLAVERR
ncbi:hypothetical protein QTO34_000161 [Cnephaeus nilssonii]|uniref:G-protein coupled receptors family 1 profile domain-containing protein n=1 Tax=Cnephaeus nilssonii TaxID=3371016 RepID=A0AA40LWP1_CNENI|nr:hypothetical protein QTO34_000161 [Eptesicus nilssonii]